MDTEVAIALVLSFLALAVATVALTRTMPGPSEALPPQVTAPVPDLRALIGRLDPQARRQLESAAEVVRSAAQFEVGIEHWLAALATDPGPELQARWEEFGVRPSRVCDDVQSAIHRLPAGNSGVPTISRESVDLLVAAAACADECAGATPSAKGARAGSPHVGVRSSRESAGADPVSGPGEAARAVRPCHVLLALLHDESLRRRLGRVAALDRLSAVTVRAWIVDHAATRWPQAGA